MKNFGALWRRNVSDNPQLFAIANRIHTWITIGKCQAKDWKVVFRFLSYSQKNDFPKTSKYRNVNCEMYSTICVEWAEDHAFHYQWPWPLIFWPQICSPPPVTVSRVSIKFTWNFAVFISNAFFSALEVFKCYALYKSMFYLLTYLLNAHAWFCKTQEQKLDSNNSQNNVWTWSKLVQWITGA